MQLHQPAALEQFAAVDARLLVVSFAPLEETTDWVPYFKETYSDKGNVGDETKLSRFERTRFLADPELSAYHAYGLGRHSVLEAYGPGIVWQYLRWMLGGRRLRTTTQDTLQRGGDFVVGRDGRLIFAHVGRDQSERPTVDELVAAIRSAD